MEQYINKSALVAEVKRLAEVGRTNASCFDKYRKEEAIWLQQADVCDRILSFINTIEAKEVDTATTEQLIEAAKTVVRERYKFRPLPIYLLEEALESLGINWEE